MSDPGALSRDFQETANLRSLIEFARASGRDAKGYERVADGLEPVLGPLRLGEHPRYGEVGTAELEREVGATCDIVRFLAASPKADLRVAGLTLMGILGWDEFIDDLSDAARSPEQWERLTAIDALARAGSALSFGVLDALREHSDPETRDAVAAARGSAERAQS